MVVRRLADCTASDLGALQTFYSPQLAPPVERIWPPFTVAPAHNVQPLFATARCGPNRRVRLPLPASVHSRRGVASTFCFQSLDARESCSNGCRSRIKFCAYPQIANRAEVGAFHDNSGSCECDCRSAKKRRKRTRQPAREIIRGIEMCKRLHLKSASPVIHSAELWLAAGLFPPFFPDRME